MSYYTWYTELFYMLFLTVELFYILEAINNENRYIFIAMMKNKLH